MTAVESLLSDQRDSSLIDHPTNLLLLVRQDYHVVCDQNLAATILLARLDFWTVQRRNKGAFDGWLEKTQADLLEALFYCFSDKPLRAAIELLVDKGFVERRRRPKSMDRRWQYRVCVDQLQLSINRAFPAQRRNPQISLVQSAEMRNAPLRHPSPDREVDQAFAAELRNPQIDGMQAADMPDAFGRSTELYRVIQDQSDLSDSGYLETDLDPLTNGDSFAAASAAAEDAPPFDPDATTEAFAAPIPTEDESVTNPVPVPSTGSADQPHPQPPISDAPPSPSPSAVAEMGAAVQPTRVVNIADPGVLEALRAGDPRFVYCGRPNRYYRMDGSPFANPFIILKDTSAERMAAIAKFKEFLLAPAQEALQERVLTELRGKTLVCFCHPKACHCDILAAFADGTLNNEITAPEGKGTLYASGTGKTAHFCKSGSITTDCGQLVIHLRDTPKIGKQYTVCLTCQRINGLTPEQPHILLIKTWQQGLGEEVADPTFDIGSLARAARGWEKADITEEQMRLAADIAHAWYEATPGAAPSLIRWTVGDVVTMVRTALAMVRSNFTPSQVTAYLQAQYQAAFWAGKVISFDYLAKNLGAWVLNPSAERSPAYGTANSYHQTGTGASRRGGVRAGDYERPPQGPIITDADVPDLP